MRIYLLRHGIAEEGIGKRDSERALTDEGKKKLRDLLNLAKHAGVEPSLVMSSPYRRAQETAEAARPYAERMTKVPATKIRSSLRSGWPPEAIHTAQSVGQSSSSAPTGLSRRSRRS